MLLDLPFAQIASGNLAVAIVGQLEATHLSLGDEFEASSMKVVHFETALRGWGLWKQDLEHAPENAHHPLVAHADAELYDGALGIPSGIRGKTEKHAPPETFA
jgi:hypothetical protein